MAITRNDTVIVLSDNAGMVTGDSLFHDGKRAGFHYAALLVATHGYAHAMEKLTPYTQPLLISGAYDYGLYAGATAAALLITQHRMYAACNMVDGGAQ